MYISEGSNSQLAGVFEEGLWGINLEFWSVCFIELSTRNLEKKCSWESRSMLSLW